MIFKLLVCIALIASNANAYFLDHFKAQHAGEIGELAVGFGKKFTHIYSLEYLHGYVREETGGTSIISIALKNNFDLYRFVYNKAYLDLYTGIGLIHATGLRYQASRRNNFPDNYYSVGSVRGLFYIGAKGSINRSSRHQAYFESGINEYWLINYFNNSETLNFFDYVSLAIGYNFLFY